MTPFPSADRSRPSDPGTEPLPRVPGPVADPSDTLGWQPAGDRPTPPPPATRMPTAVVEELPGEVSGAVPEELPNSELPTSELSAADLPAAQPPAADLPAEKAPAADLPPEPAPGRAGRNLGAAIGVGLSLGAVILASLLIWRPAFLAVLTAAVVIGVIELARALEAGRFRVPVIPLLVGSLAMIALAWTRGSTGLVVGYLITALAVVLWRLAGGPAGYLRDAAAGVFVALYVPLLAGFAALLLLPDDGVARVLAFIATVVCSDVGGYAAGVLFGKHPMAPSISPKKSWEGLAGSVLACILVATPIIALALDGPWWAGALYGTAIAFTATIGDLAESLIKRDLRIKDMGHLLPGHGGLMDRLDSLLPSAAVAFLLLSVLAPV